LASNALEQKGEVGEGYVEQQRKIFTNWLRPMLLQEPQLN